MDSVKEEQLLRARIADLRAQAERRGRPAFSDFLDLRGQKVAREAAGPDGVFFGGFPRAERVMLCISPFPVPEGSYPLRAVRVAAGGYRELSHRDYLGTLMSLGIKREKLGDILVDSAGATLFVCAAVAPFVCENLSKVGGDGVRAELLLSLPEIDWTAQVEERCGVIASERFDCAVSEFAGKARGKASELIGRGLALLNAAEAEPSVRVAEGDVVSIRGVGKFRICDLAGRTKKGNVVIRYEKYI